MSEFKEGDLVRLVFDIKNDGTMYGKKRGVVLAQAGDTGYIHQYHRMNDDIIYEVHFLERDRKLGCKAKELIAGDLEWRPPIFKKGDQVSARVDLTHEGKLLFPKGCDGKITVIRYLPRIGYIYETAFENGNGEYCLVKESQLMEKQ